MAARINSLMKVCSPQTLSCMLRQGNFTFGLINFVNFTFGLINFVNLSTTLIIIVKTQC